MLAGTTSIELEHEKALDRILADEAFMKKEQERLEAEIVARMAARSGKGM